MNRRLLLTLTLVSLLGVAGLAGAATHEVSISGFAFSPTDLTISVGDTVHWTNQDDYPHTVTASDNSFDSGMLAFGATFLHVFTSAGDVPYYCQYHPSMTAVIHVASVPGLYDVSISGYMFQPSELHLDVGDRVRWTNNDTVPHTVTATSGQFDSGNLNPGDTFSFVFTAEGSYPYVCNYHSGMTGVIIAGNPGGGQSGWVQQLSPTTQPLNDIGFGDENVGWAAGDQGLLHTTNRGETWTMFETGVDMEAAVFVTVNGGWACGNNGVILHSTDGGQSWQTQASGVSEKLRDLWFADHANGWAVGRNGILVHTTNAGLSWSPQASPATDDLHGIHMLDAQHGWVAGADGLVLYTDNGGSNWYVQLSVPLGTEDEFDAVYALDANHVWAAGGQGRIYYSANGGQSWEQQASGTAVELTDIQFTDLDNGWVCGAGGFLGRWDTAMQMWMPAPAPANVTFNAIHFVNSSLGFLVGNDGSIYKYDQLSTSADPEHSADVPSRTELFANYPNPFNPSTTIRFQLSAAGLAQLTVFDILGRRIATLVDGPLSAGAHEVQFSGSNFPSGLYFYQLRAGDYTLSRRMMLVK